jgi:GAF domain-containing protein
MEAAGARLPSRGVQPSAAVMDRVCSACVRLIPVSGAAVSVTTPDGYRETVSATDDVVGAIEDLHFALGEGPGVAALRECQPVLIGDLANGAGDRWPLFVPAALHVGARAVFAYPLLVGAGQLGVLLMYADRPGRLDLTQRAQAVRLAHAASFAVLDLLSGMTERAGADGFEVDRDFHRSGVYQASGMVMVQLGVSIEDALIRLRAHAFAHDVPLGEVAQQIVERTLRLDAEPEGRQ